MKNFEQLLRTLEASDKKAQESAAEKLANFRPTPDQGIQLISAAAKTYPNDSERTYETIGARLLRSCWRHPDPGFVEIIKSFYGEFCSDKDKQWQCLRILTELKTTESLQAFVELLNRPESRSFSLEMPLIPLLGTFWGSKKPPATITAVFPAWFDLADKLDDLSRVYSLISTCHNLELLDFKEHPSFVSNCVAKARHDLAIIIDASSASKTQADADHVGPEVQRAILDLEWLLYLFGNMEHPDIPEIVTKSLAAPNPQVQLFAVSTALSLGIAVPDQILLSLAATPSKRHRLWQLLEGNGHLDRFPKRYRTTAMLAEANMVRWLEFPTEMGRPPEEIEHLTMVRSQNKQGEKMESHFFKFRRSDFCDGKWFVGFAGTYTTGELTLDGEGTFSQFEELDSRSTDEHAAMYLEYSEA